jgi:DNA-binding MarR family transcriptional regulator
MSFERPSSINHEWLLNFRLWKLAALASAPVIRLCEGVYGVTRREWLFISLLVRDGPLAPSDLSERGGLDRARTSKALGSLLCKGLVLRETVPGAKPRARISLTAAGMRLAEEIYPQIADINEQVAAALDEPARQALDDALWRLTERAAKVNQEMLADVRTDRHLGGWHRKRPNVNSP